MKEKIVLPSLISTADTPLTDYRFEMLSGIRALFLIFATLLPVFVFVPAG